MLLDEPTTFLDLNYRVEILDLLAELNETRGRTIVMVLHEVNEACRVADHVIAMRDGAIVAEGVPATVVTEAVVRSVFDLECRVVPDPVTGTPMVVPLPRRLRRRVR
jgi:iron complex transport system ATP-binding protein